MFCDLVGSTSLSGRLDPEELREILRAYQGVCAAVIGRFDGQIAQYLGDGILAYFGYPVAHEDDARRAVSAGLEILEATVRLSSGVDGEHSGQLAVRIGVHTGLVVAGEMGAGGWREDLAVGETPNIAARLQSLAQPNSLLISTSTHRLVRGYFNCAFAGAYSLKGILQPLEVHKVIGATEAQGRLEASGSTVIEAPLGREHEIALLHGFWAEVRRGAGRAVMVSGEGGIGKSRLLQSCIDNAESAPYTRLRYYCSEHHTSSPLYPIIRQLERAAGFKSEDVPTARLDKLEALLAPSSPNVEALSLVADLLSVPDTQQRYPPLGLSPQGKRQKTFAALLHLIEVSALATPMLILFEDVHWIDPSSREILETMIALVSRLPILAVITFRPEFDASWARGSHVTRIALGRLDEASCRTLIERIAGRVRLTERTLGEIVERSDGVPLFAEELTMAVLESGAVSGDSRGPPHAVSYAATVPETLYSTLLARLDRLGTSVKEVAQIGAVIGRQFYYRLLVAVSRRTEAELQRSLEILGEAAILVCRGAPPDATYTFRHALVQDAAYETLLIARRRDLHSAIADELELRHVGAAVSQELLAHHRTQAGQSQKAVRAWRAAARQSVDRGSFAEAHVQILTALSLLENLTKDAERDRHEVGLQNALGNVLIAQRGYTAHETRGAFQQARALAAQLADPGQELRALWGLGTGLLFEGRLAAVLDMMKDAAPLVEKNGHLDARLAFSVVHGSVLLDLGRLEEARSRLENTLAIDNDPGRDRERALLYGQSPRISALGYLSVVSLILNRTDSAEYSVRSINEAEVLSHKPMLCLSHSVACRRAWLAGERSSLTTHAAELQRVATDEGAPVWLALAKAYIGWSFVEDGEMEEGIAAVREGISECQANGANSEMPLLTLALARALGRASKIPAAMELLSDTVQGGIAGEERWMDAEIHRAMGDFLVEQRRYDEADAALRKALKVARIQGARLFELRAGTTLSQLLLSRSRGREASEVLRPLCDAADAPPELLALLRSAERAAPNTFGDRHQ